MKNLNYKERYLRALRREPVDRVPVPSFCTHPLIELMKYIGLSAPGIHYQVGDMADFAMAAAEVLGFEGVRLPTDGVIEAEAMGCRIEKGDMGRNPSVVGHPFSLDPFEIPADLLKQGKNSPPSRSTPDGKEEDQQRVPCDVSCHGASNDLVPPDRS